MVYPLLKEFCKAQSSVDVQVIRSINILKNMSRGELTKVSSLFDKYKKTLIAPEASVINAFLEVMEDLLSVKLSKEKVRYNPTSRTLSLRGLGALRSEVKIREDEILNHLRGRLGEKSSPRRVM